MCLKFKTQYNCMYFSMINYDINGIRKVSNLELYQCLFSEAISVWSYLQINFIILTV